jgi:hypothetical protein
LSEVLPVSARSDAEIALELGRVQALKAVLAAYEAELVLGLAAHRPESLDPRPGAPGAGVNARTPTPPAGAPTAPTCAACAGATTGSRPTPRAGDSCSLPPGCCG